jgi:hypothetical protein
VVEGVLGPVGRNGGDDGGGLLSGRCRGDVGGESGGDLGDEADEAFEDMVFLRNVEIGVLRGGHGYARVEGGRIFKSSI